MAFGGTFGPAGAMIPFGIIRNIDDEVGIGYDADDNIIFQRASGSTYTPARVDTLIVAAVPDQQNPQVDPLTAIVLGVPNPANGDTGQLVSSPPNATQHGLPANFGPGRNKWGGPTGNQFRLRITSAPVRNAVAVPQAQGAIEVAVGSAAPNVFADIRNTSNEVVPQLQLTIENTHSVQG